jgi:hypothetical protein
LKLGSRSSAVNFNCLKGFQVAGKTAWNNLVYSRYWTRFSVHFGHEFSSSKAAAARPALSLSLFGPTFASSRLWAASGPTEGYLPPGSPTSCTRQGLLLHDWSVCDEGKVWTRSSNEAELNRVENCRIELRGCRGHRHTKDEQQDSRRGNRFCYKQPSTCIRDLWKLHVVGRSVSESHPSKTSKKQLEGAVVILRGRAGSDRLTPGREYRRHSSIYWVSSVGLPLPVPRIPG